MLLRLINQLVLSGIVFCNLAYRFSSQISLP